MTFPALPASFDGRGLFAWQVTAGNSLNRAGNSAFDSRRYVIAHDFKYSINGFVVDEYLLG